MVKRFEKILEVIFAENFAVWLTIFYVVAIDLFGDVEPLKLIEFCAKLGFMYAGLSYIEIRRIRRMLTEQKRNGQT